MCGGDSDFNCGKNTSQLLFGENFEDGEYLNFKCDDKGLCGCANTGPTIEINDFDKTRYVCIDSKAWVEFGDKFVEEKTFPQSGYQWIKNIEDKLFDKLSTDVVFIGEYIFDGDIGGKVSIDDETKFIVLKIEKK